MNQAYKLLIFDWDGTLVDSLGYIIECIQKATEDVGLELPPVEKIRHCIGLSAHNSLQTLFPDVSSTVLQQIMARYRERFFLSNVDRVRLFDDVKKHLNELHQMDYLLAVATAKSRRGLNQELTATTLKDLFSMTRTVDEALAKPHPQMVIDILEGLGIQPDEALMIGDTAYDLEMATNAKIKSVAFTYGGHSKDQLEAQSPLACFDTFPEFAAWIKKQ